MALFGCLASVSGGGGWLMALEVTQLERVYKTKIVEAIKYLIYHGSKLWDDENINII